METLRFGTREETIQEGLSFAALQTITATLADRRTTLHDSTTPVESTRFAVFAGVGSATVSRFNNLK